MSKENVNEKRSNTPILIIGLVLVIALIGAWWFYASSKSATTANNSNSIKTAKASTIPANAPPGAQPPNQAGSASAAVRLEEFADFQCPQCANEHPILNEIKSIYGSRIHFIFREFPLDIKAHDKSYDAAIAAEAAGLQGKFWEMQGMLFNNQKTWTDDPNFKQVWKGYAQKIGLDITKWEGDIAGLAARGRVDADKQRGRAIGLTGTPSLFINGNAVKLEDMQEVDKLKALIDAELAKAAQPASGQPDAPASPGKVE